MIYIHFQQEYSDTKQMNVNQGELDHLFPTKILVKYSLSVREGKSNV